MKRTPLTDGSGGWFNRDTAIAFSEDTRFDGSNRISCATGTQWEHEKLFFTKSGKWVKHSWSQWQGAGYSYALIDHQEAARWLTENNTKDIEHLPETAQKAIREALDATEV